MYCVQEVLTKAPQSLDTRTVTTRSHTGRVDIDWRQSERLHHLTLSGQIDENADLAAFAARLTGDVVIDLEKVSFVNSMGVRRWTDMLALLQGNGVAVTLTRCSEAMLMQMNINVAVKGFSRIESFFAPYTCPQCEQTESVCIEVLPNLQALRRMQVPLVQCPRCGVPCEFAEIPARYLLFLDA